MKMEETLAERLTRSCRYFTGLGEKECSRGVRYVSARDRENRTISCLKMGGSLLGHNDCVCNRLSLRGTRRRLWLLRFVSETRKLTL